MKEMTGPTATEMAIKEGIFGDKVKPTPDSEPMYSNAIHTPEMWKKIAKFIVRLKIK